MARKLIKYCSDEDKITFIIRRVPHGKIFAVRRSQDGESLGIRREGGTGEVRHTLGAGTVLWNVGHQSKGSE